MFNMRRVGDLMILQSDLLPVSLKHAFSTRRLSKPAPAAQPSQVDFQFDSIDQTSQWWLKLRNSIFTPKHTLYIHKQVHGGIVNVIDPDNSDIDEKDIGGLKVRHLGEGDGIIKPFSRKPAFIGITTADCLPCVAFHPPSGAVGVIHAGWRGLAADIPSNAVHAFKDNIGAQPKELFWAIGPFVDARNYEVGNEVIAALETAGYADSDWQNRDDVTPGWTRAKRRDHFMLDLGACMKMRLLTLGVPSEQIDICSLSTFGNPNLFFSYRRDGAVKGLMACVVG
jgi:polyphenol oxidase